MTAPAQPATRLDRALAAIERIGNKLPDPALLFVILLIIAWITSALLASLSFSEIDPRTGQPITIINQLTGPALAKFFSNMLTTFTGFHPLGVVLVALLGVGVAEYSGFINAGLKALLNVTTPKLLTPLTIFVATLSHTAADAGYVLVIPLGAVMYAAAGRHPVVGIAAAFAGVSGGFSANILPSAIDPLLQGLTQSAAQMIDPNHLVNPLNNWYFLIASTVLIVLVGWYVTDRIIEPRLRSVPVDGDGEAMPKLDPLSATERRGLRAGLAAMVAGLALLTWLSWPDNSALRSPTGALTAADAPLMQSIVPLIFLLFLIPGVIHGYVAGTIKSHRDVIDAMSKAMSTMGHYIVIAFFASLFIAAFGQSNLGALIAIKGANTLQALAMPAQITIVGIILITMVIDLVIGSASAKWALLAPIFVPMLMQLGISPDLTQAAYRVGDSSANIITPMMPYFPLVVVYVQRYVKGAGIGTLVSTMLPYTVTFIIAWTILLLIFWGLGIPLGLQATYHVTP